MLPAKQNSGLCDTCRPEYSRIMRFCSVHCYWILIDSGAYAKGGHWHMRQKSGYPSRLASPKTVFLLLMSYLLQFPCTGSLERRCWMSRTMLKATPCQLSCSRDGNNRMGRPSRRGQCGKSRTLVGRHQSVSGISMQSREIPVSCKTIENTR